MTDRESREELTLRLRKTASLANIIIEYSFSGGDLKELERKGLNEGSFDVAIMLFDLIREAQELTAEMFGAPVPEPPSTA